MSIKSAIAKTLLFLGISTSSAVAVASLDNRAPPQIEQTDTYVQLRKALSDFRLATSSYMTIATKYYRNDKGLISVKAALYRVEANRIEITDEAHRDNEARTTIIRFTKELTALFEKEIALITKQPVEKDLAFEKELAEIHAKTTQLSNQFYDYLDEFVY